MFPWPHAAPSPRRLADEKQLGCPPGLTSRALPHMGLLVRHRLPLYARITGATPPVIVRGEDADDLADQILRWQRLMIEIKHDRD